MTEPATIASRPGALARALALFLAAAALAGCGTVSALTSASAPLDAYTLTPLAGQGGSGGGRGGGGGGGGGGARHLVVATPSASGAIATDRILVAPNRLQAAYLPGARWVDAAPVMLQTLLVQSLQASGGFRLVGRTDAGFFADYSLLSEMRAFQIEPGPAGGPAFLARIAVTMTLARESDGAILATRDFAASAPAASVDPLAVVAAFDAAMRDVQRQAVAWTAASAGAGGV